MNNLNVFILFSTLIYFKLEENKSGNLKIAVGLVALYALYNLFKGSEGFIDAPSDNIAGTRFCGTTNRWVAQTTASPPTCTAKDSGDADACSGVQNLGDSSACDDVIKDSAKACTWAQGTGGGAGTCTPAQGVDPVDPVDAQACGAVDITDATECNAVIKNTAKACTWTDPGSAGGDGTCDHSGDDPVDAQACGAVDLTDATECNAVIKNSEKACTYTPAVQGFPAHCKRTIDNKICGTYTNDGTIITAPPPGYADMTDTKCNAIECHVDSDCGTNKKKCENNKCAPNTMECPSSCNSLQDPSPGEPNCGTININEGDCADPSKCCSYNSGYLAAAILGMGFVLFVGCIPLFLGVLKDWWGVSLCAVIIDGIIAYLVFGGWQYLFD